MGRSMAETPIANGGEVEITRPPSNPESLPGKLVDSFSGDGD